MWGALSACTYLGIWRLISCIGQVKIYISYTKYSSIVRSQGTRFLHTVTFMVSTSIIFQFWQHLDAAVRMFGDAACVECHVTHTIWLHLARCRLDWLPLLKKEKEKYPKQVWLPLLCSIVLSQLRCERKKVSISKETTLSWKKLVNQGVFNVEWKDLLSSNVLC